MPMENDTHERVRFIAENGIIAALYYGLTMLFIMVPVISQFGPIQCRLSEFLILLVFFKPRLTWGLTLGCFLVNMTGAITGQNFPIDMLFGTMATFLSCIGIAYASKFLCISLLYPIILNGVIVGLELYFLADDGLPLIACMGYVAIGEAIAMVFGYIILMIIIRNKGAMKVFGPTRHADTKF